MFDAQTGKNSYRYDRRGSLGMRKYYHLRSTILERNLERVKVGNLVSVPYTPHVTKFSPGM